LKDDPKSADPKTEQQPNLKLDQHRLTKTTDKAIQMKSSKRSNQEPTTVKSVNYERGERQRKTRKGSKGNT